LLWLASSCRPARTAAAAFVVAFAIVWTTTFGAGILGDAGFPITERIVAGQVGILAISLCSLVIAALFAERRQHEATLMESETRLQQALTAGSVTAFDWDVRTGLSRRSDGRRKSWDSIHTKLFTRATSLNGSIQTINCASNRSCAVLVPKVRPMR
jgi:hypothetical protein